MEEVCAHLLPNGKIKGNLWVIGGIDGSPGESLQITINGPAAGRFVDFANKEEKGATPLWLWSKARNVTFPQAITQAAEFLNIKESDYGVKRHKQKSYAKPAAGGVRLTECNTPVMDYLTGERRLDPIVVVKAKVCETDDAQTIVFPFIEKVDGKDVCVHRKYLNLAREDGKKKSWTTKDTKRCLYGKNLISDTDASVVICEGEIDALSWNSWSIPAVSIPMGVSDMEWVDLDWEWLARFEKIYVSTDMDEPGRAAAQEICKRLGLHRTYIVELPHKDANDCLVAGVKREEMLSFLAAAKGVELDEIKRPSAFRSEVMEHYSQDPTQVGFPTPWTPSLPWRVRKGELTVLSGFSGHGKTQGLNQLMLHLINSGAKIMDASLEIRSGLTLYYMTRCALAQKEPTKDEVNACVDFLNDSMFFLDCIGTVNVDRLMQAMEYARKRHGIDVFVIDSLFKCGLSGEDYAGARAFSDRLTTFCNNTGAHVILVAHSRKTQNGNESNVPSKSDVAGSSDITNAAFNVIIFWRNKRKKREMDEAKYTNNFEALEKLEQEPDGRIVIDKQRFGGGEEGEVYTWFDKDACQFHVTRNTKIPYFRLNS